VHMRFKKLQMALLAAAFIPSVALANKVVFVNKSSWDITEIYFSSAKSKNWGEDHLEDEILANGESLTLTGVSKGKWDVRVVDEDGDECIIEDVAINSNDKWVIEDDDLLACQNK
jgi:hypothetical protein